MVDNPHFSCANFIGYNEFQMFTVGFNKTKKTHGIKWDKTKYCNIFNIS